MNETGQKSATGTGSTGVKRYTNLHSWRQEAVQLITVRPGERAGSVRATLHATVADSVLGAALARLLVSATPLDGRVYIIGANEKGIVHSAKDAMDFAIDDFLNGGANGEAGELGLIKR